MQKARTTWTILIPIITGILMLGCGVGASPSKPTQTPIFVVVPAGGLSISTADTTQLTPNGFPTPLTCEAGAVEQPFEHGRMFWVGRSLQERCSIEHAFAPETGEIWVAIFDDRGQGGIWFSFLDSWDAQNDIPFDLTMTEPAGLSQPVRGFGRVWREELTAEQRTSLGWATGRELAYTATYRYDAGGTITDTNTYTPGAGQDVLSSVIGERFFFDEQTGMFDYIPASDE